MQPQKGEGPWVIAAYTTDNDVYQVLTEEFSSQEQAQKYLNFLMTRDRQPISDDE